MKLLFLFLGLSFISLSKAQTFDDPIKYNDYMIGLQTQIGEKFVAFNDKLALETTTYESITPYFDQLLTTIDEVLVKLKNVTPYQKNIALKTSLLNLIEYYKVAVSTDYKEMLKIIYLDAEPDYNRMTAIYEKVVKEESQFDKVFQEEQKKYAKKYNIALKENELQDKFDEE